MTSNLMGATPAGVPTLPLETPRGNKRWVFELGTDGPLLVDGSDDPPQWVQQSAQWWWVAVTRCATELSASRDTMQALATRLAGYADMATMAMLYEVPQARERAIAEVHRANREALRPGAPPDLVAALDAFASRLTWQIHRFAPAKSIRDDGPTSETVEKQQPSPVQQLYEACGLSTELRQIADRIVEVRRALLAPIDVKTSNLDGAGGGPSYSYEQPLARLRGAMETEYLERYRPWSQGLAKRPAFSGSRASQFDVTMHMLLNGGPLADVEALYRLPLDRARLILAGALYLYEHPAALSGTVIEGQP